MFPNLWLLPKLSTMQPPVVVVVVVVEVHGNELPSPVVVEVQGYELPSPGVVVTE